MNETCPSPDEYAEVLESLLEELDRLPAFLRRGVEKELREVLDLLRDKRPPRFMLAGRRGAGKTTLLNALFGRRVARIGAVRAQTGRARWHTLSDSDRKIQVLDTRGWAEGGEPEEEDEAGTALESIINAMEQKHPDIILFMVPARSVDAHIDNDLDELEGILQKAKELKGGELPLVGVVTQADQLDPIDERPPTDDEEKNENIAEACRVLQRHIRGRDELAGRLVSVLPVVAWARYSRDGAIEPSRDYRWNMDLLVEEIFEKLPEQAGLDFARLSRVKDFQRKVAKRVVDACSAAAGLIGTQPIPLADLPFITTIQGVMIVMVAYVSGRPMSFETARELIVALGGNVGVAFGVREGARALLKLVPVGGHMASGAVAAAATLAIGRGAIAYFIEDVDEEEIRSRLNKEKGPKNEKGK